MLLKSLETQKNNDRMNHIDNYKRQYFNITNKWR